MYFAHSEKSDGNGLLSLSQENKSVVEYDEEFTFDKVFILSMMNIVIPEFEKPGIRHKHQPQTKNLQANNICPKCVKPHLPHPCYCKIGACFNCGKRGHKAKE